MTRLDRVVMLLLGGLVGVGRGRGKARQRARQGDDRIDVGSVSSGQVTSHNVEMRFKPRRELKEPGHLRKSAQADDSGCDGRALGARKGQKE